jgi:hypothetical protein
VQQLAAVVRALAQRLAAAELAQVLVLQPAPAPAAQA